MKRLRVIGNRLLQGYPSLSFIHCPFSIAFRWFSNDGGGAFDDRAGRFGLGRDSGGGLCRQVSRLFRGWCGWFYVRRFEEVAAAQVIDQKLFLSRKTVRVHPFERCPEFLPPAGFAGLKKDRVDLFA